ncbi:MAG: hypothetical protein JW729_03220 [Bacteroidales bacterium]|nr:hypothetical protein [Bacteroidales bacterium]
MKTNNKIGFLVLALLLIFASSCRQIAIIESSTEIVSRGTNIALNDSALIYGSVIFAGTENMPEPGASIWIEGTDIKTTSDVWGHYSLQILPGTYKIKCLGLSSDERFIATLDNISLLPNEEIEIRFYLGSISE